MAPSSFKSFSLIVSLTTIFTISLKPCSCHNKTHWNTAGITWYGDREGPGSTGGACGYTDAVAKPPYNCMVSAGGPSLYQDGKGCGTCYRLKCHHPLCTGRPIKVMIADECPGCGSKNPVHFDLSGKAFGALAKPGMCDQLRNLGELKVTYKRACCKHPKSMIAIHMDPGSNPYYLSFNVKYVNGDGNFACIEVQPAGGQYIKMEKMRSAVWKINSGTPLKGPFNVRLTSAVSGQKIVANCVIPEKWSPGSIYHSKVNFPVPLKKHHPHKKPHHPVHKKPHPVHKKPHPFHKKPHPVHKKPHPFHKKPHPVHKKHK